METQTQSFTDGLLMVTDNDRETYDALTAMAHETHERIELADRIKDYVETLTDDVTGTTSGDLIVSQLFSWALAEVDWLAVANHYIEKVEAE